MKPVLTLLVGTLLALAAWLAFGGDEAPMIGLESEPIAGPVVEAPLVPLERPDLPRATNRVSESMAVEPRDDAEQSVSSPDATILVEGRVLDLGGLPVANVDVRQVSGSPRARTDSEGRFRIEFDPSSGASALRVESEAWTTVYECLVLEEGVGRDYYVVVAPAIELAGHVVDEAGNGIQLANVRIDALSKAADHFPLPLDGNRLLDCSTSTEEDGSFVLSPAPRLRSESNFRLSARQNGFEGLELPLPLQSTRDLRFVLPRVVDDSPKLTGVVLLPDGGPATEARVRLGENHARTGDDGRFALPIPESIDSDLPLVAGSKDYGPAVVEGFGATVNAHRPKAPPELILRLGPSLEIRGVLLDEAGEPATGWQLSLHDATEVSRNKFPPDLAEAVGTGESSVSTSKDGSFRLRNLLPRDYTLLVRNRETLQSFYTAPIAAGDEAVVLRVPQDGLHAFVRGVVVDHTGVPVEHAYVAVGLILHRSESGWSSTSRKGVTTDAEGRFELTDVPKEHVHFALGGDAIVPVQFDWTEEMDPLELVFEVERRCHFRVRVSGTERDDLNYTIVDEAGEELMITTYHAGGSGSSTRQHLAPGENPVRTVTRSAQRLLVYHNSEVVHEQPIWLDPLTVTEVVIELP